MEAIPNQPPPKTVQKKKHSIEILQEVIDHTIWELFDQMDLFEYEDDYAIQYDQPIFDFTGTPFYSVIIEQYQEMLMISSHLCLLTKQLYRTLRRKNNPTMKKEERSMKRCGRVMNC